jgi:hypothetical protein
MMTSAQGFHNPKSGAAYTGGKQMIAMTLRRIFFVANFPYFDLLQMMQ